MLRPRSHAAAVCAVLKAIQVLHAHALGTARRPATADVPDRSVGNQRRDQEQKTKRATRRSTSAKVILCFRRPRLLPQAPPLPRPRPNPPQPAEHGKPPNGRVGKAQRHMLEYGPPQSKTDVHTARRPVFGQSRAVKIRRERQKTTLSCAMNCGATRTTSDV